MSTSTLKFTLPNTPDLRFGIVDIARDLAVLTLRICGRVVDFLALDAVAVRYLVYEQRLDAPERFDGFFFDPLDEVVA